MHFDLGSLVTERQLVIDDVLHVGAHHGQEAETYQQLGAKRVTWVEANPAVVPVLRRNVEQLGHRVLEALVTDRTGESVEFYVTNNEQSSSALELGTHRYEHPDIVVTESVWLKTSTLDDLCASEGIGNPDLLVLDVQGAELLVLRGAERVIANAKCICTEINERPLYAGAALLPELDAFLGAHGFHRAATTLTIHGYGDALFVRSDFERSAPSEGERGARITARSALPTLRHGAASRVRGIVRDAVTPQFDSVESQLDQLSHRMTVIEQMLVHNEQETTLLRQRVDECLALMRSQDG